jgi:hypothetical protein
MIKFVVHTQVRENYGAHNWDGNGACPQHWKFKGGNAYAVSAVSLDLAIKHVESRLAPPSEGYEEYVIGAELRINWDATMRQRLEAHGLPYGAPDQLTECGVAA